MTELRRSVFVAVACGLLLPLLALSVRAPASPGAAGAPEQASPAQIGPQTQTCTARNSDLIPLAAASSFYAFRFLIAQTEIPDVLIPSVVPSAGPAIPPQTAPQQPTTVVTTVNNNNTTAANTGINFSLDKIVGSISTIFIIALIPLLFIIGALFYFFFMGDHDRTTLEERETNAELNDTSEYEEWREL
jgi:hypothetical protein